MSRKTHPGDQDMQSLLEKVRRLELENKRLKEKSSMGERASVVQKSVKIDLPPRNYNPHGKALPSPTKTLTVDMGGGIKLTIYADSSHGPQNQMHQNTNSTIILSCEVKSTEEFDATVIMKPKINDNGYGNGRGLNAFLVDFLRISERGSKGSKHSVDTQNNGYNNYATTLTIDVKLIRMTPISLIESADDQTVTVVIEKQKLLVNVPYVSKWSQFLQAYFASNMEEKANGVYPINECSFAEFSEMLEVIYPSSKPIDESNVEAMLDMADRFIMPMLTRKCEIFLSTSHGISDIRIIGMADRFNLIRTRIIVLERQISTASLRSKIIKEKGYSTLSDEMKKEVEGRYVQLDVQEKEGNQSRGFSYNDDDEYSE